ncbi:MAG: hypothetical protein ABH986_02825 [archaeon]
MEKGQISNEYLVLSAIILSISAFLFVFSQMNASTTIDISMTQNAVKTLAKAADSVYSLGPENQLFVEIEIPGGITGQYVSNNQVGYLLNLSGTNTDIYENTKAFVVGELPTEQGRHFVLVQVLESGTTRIGGGLTIIPAKFIRAIRPGTNDSNVFSVWNNTSRALADLNVTLKGNITDIASLNGENSRILASIINPNQTINFDVNWSVATTHPATDYSGYIELFSAEGYIDKSIIQIRVPHVLKDINVSLFGDANYSTPKTIFYQGETIYYKVSVSDHIGEVMDISDLNITLSDPPPVTSQSVLTGLATTNGIYLGTESVSCTSETGVWSILAQGKKFDSASDSNSFQIDTATQASKFSFDYSDAYTTGTRLVDFAYGNVCSPDITINRMRVNVSSGIMVNEIELNGDTVWSGAPTANWVNLDWPAGTLVTANTLYTSNNEMKFSSAAGNGNAYTIDFEFSDSSVYTVSFVK